TTSHIWIGNTFPDASARLVSELIDTRVWRRVSELLNEAFKHFFQVYLKILNSHHQEYLRRRELGLLHKVLKKARIGLLMSTDFG
ncbi:unnamed protein product, partial [Ilex paraguariensis]